MTNSISYRFIDLVWIDGMYNKWMNEGDDCLSLQQVYRLRQQVQEWGVSCCWCWSPRSASLPIHQRQWSLLNEWCKKTVALRLMRFPSHLVLAMAVLAILCMMYSSTSKCVQDGCQDNSHQNWRNDIWVLAKKFWGIAKLNGCFSSEHSDWRWKLGPFFPARNKESIERVATSEFTETQNVSCATFSG